jgi:hypothetical protein
MLLKNKFFWFSTVIFLAVSLGAIWRLYPPILSQLRTNNEKSRQLDADLQAAESQIKNISTLTNKADQLNEAYLLAQRALPVNPEADLLLLELEGLLNDLGLTDVKITVPFQNTTPISAAPADDGAARPGGAANTTKPIVKSSGASTTFTLSGEISYPQLKTLLERLRTLSRWNKITSLEIAKVSDRYSTTITAEFFTRPAPTQETTLDSTKIFEQAKTVFGKLRVYTAKPDSSKEGSYGKENPFE